MTPEQKPENVVLLARAVMGWRPNADFGAYEDGSIAVFSVGGVSRRWDPYTSIADAMGMLDRFEWWELKHDGAGYYCTIYGVTKGIGNTYRVARERNYFDSICTACLEWAWVQGRGGK